MIKTTYRPPAIRCGGLNALYPLHRNCQVVVPGTCEPSDAPPAGVWFDGMLLTFPPATELKMFGFPVPTSVELEMLLDESDIDMFLVVDENATTLETSFVQMLGNIVADEDEYDNTVEFLPGWEHLAAITAGGMIASAALSGQLSVNDETKALGLAISAGIMSAGDGFVPESAETIEIEGVTYTAIGAAWAPRYLPNGAAQIEVRDRATHAVLRTEPVLMRAIASFSSAYISVLYFSETQTPVSATDHVIRLVPSSRVELNGWRAFSASIKTPPEQSNSLPGDGLEVMSVPLGDESGTPSSGWDVLKTIAFSPPGE